MTTISQNLWTAGLPDVDILIRTGKEKRLSNVMIWQCAYAKIHFLDKYWPDITRNDIEQIYKKFNDNIVITAQLIDHEDRHRWAENYNEKFNDVFKIQADIAKRIVEQLDITISPGEEKIMKQT